MQRIFRVPLLLLIVSCIPCVPASGKSTFPQSNAAHSQSTIQNPQLAATANSKETNWWVETGKAGLNCLAILVGGAATALLWSLAQKRRELQLAAADQFYDVYGEFLEILRLWKGVRSVKVAEVVVPGPKDDEERWNLYVRACRAEGKLEGFLARLASQQNLDEVQLRSAASFRQVYQILRQNIRDNQPIDWKGANDPGYLTFKKYACDLVAMATPQLRLFGLAVPFFGLPRPATSSTKLAAIMSNEWEGAKWTLSAYEIAQFLDKVDKIARKSLHM